MENAETEKRKKRKRKKLKWRMRRARRKMMGMKRRGKNGIIQREKEAKEESTE